MRRLLTLVMVLLGSSAALAADMVLTPGTNVVVTCTLPEAGVGQCDTLDLSRACNSQYLGVVVF
jgi:hypothetical protein